MVDIAAEDANLNEEIIFASEEDRDKSPATAHKNPNRLNNIQPSLKYIFIVSAIILFSVAIFSLGGVIGAGEEIVKIDPLQPQPDPGNKLVYISAVPNEQKFTDPMFNLSTNALGLERNVEMYQWAKEDGQYIKKWSGELIVIDDEGKTKGYANPLEFPFTSEKWIADKISIGKLTLSSELARQLKTSEPLVLTNDIFLKLDPEGQKAFKLYKDSYFFGINPEKPNVGDLRISFKKYPAVNVSIVAKKSGDVLDVYVGKNGPIGILRTGKIELAELTQGIDLGSNAIVKWSFRIIAVLFFLASIFIIIGLRKRNHANSNANDFEIISHNETYIEEEPAPSFTDNTKQSEYSSSEHVPQNIFENNTDIATYPTYENFTEEGKIPQPLPEILPFPITSTPFDTTSEPTESTLPKQFASPEPLDFTSSNSGLNSTDISNYNTEPPINIAEPNIPQSSQAFENMEYIISASRPSVHTNYSGNEYENQSEEIPFEVEVISEDSMVEQPQNIGSLYPRHEEFLEPSGFKSATHTPFLGEQSYDTQASPHLNADELYEKIPTEVEIISEESLLADTDENKNFPEPEVTNDDIVEDNLLTSLPLPPPPDYNSLFTDEVPESTDEENNTETYPLPPKPDFDKLFGNIDSIDESIDEPTANINSDLPDIAENLSHNTEIPALEKNHDFGNELQPNVPPHTDFTNEPPQSVNFDLPGIADDFDPNAEMPRPEFHYDETSVGDNQHGSDEPFSGDYEHSPFVDAEDDPFGHNDENKNSG